MTTSKEKTAGESERREFTGAKLSGTPKLAFLRNPGGDMITRKKGSWDGDDGFAIGQTITITGAMNAGTFMIAGITDEGSTLVLDARYVVTEMVTSALSVTGAWVLPAVEVPAPKISVPDSKSHKEGAPQKDSASNRVKDPEPVKRAAVTPQKSAPGTLDEQPDTEKQAKSPVATPSEDRQEGSTVGDEEKPEVSSTTEKFDPEDAGLSADAPGRAIRSGTEIARMLQAICEEELPVTAYPEDGEQLFVSKIRGVDPDLNRLILDYSQWKPANSAVLECEEVLFHSERKNRHIQFLGEVPSEIVFAGNAGIQVGFPQFVLDLQQRSHRRINVKYLPSLWCVIKVEGDNSIVANVTDISRGGMGGVVHDLGATLKPGAIIKDCQITGSSLKRPIDVSVEVRHWKTVRSKDGTLSKKVGCRFVTSPQKLQEMIKAFEADLDGQ